MPAAPRPLPGEGLAPRTCALTGLRLLPPPLMDTSTQNEGLNRCTAEAGVGTAVRWREDSAEVSCRWTGHWSLTWRFYLFQKCRVH